MGTAHGEISGRAGVDALTTLGGPIRRGPFEGVRWPGRNPEEMIGAVDGIRTRDLDVGNVASTN